MLQRRHFLQAATSALVTLGIGQFEIQQHGANYAKAIAQSTPRKRALLIGINEYPGDSGIQGEWSRLQGAVTDTMLQKELLTHRFGFGEIRTLVDDQAKRSRILEEIEDLVRWAKPGDVVVIHYSGHGSTVVDPHQICKDGVNGTIVPIDSEFKVQGGQVQDITSGTLFLLMSAIKTENLTVVLDSCYSGAGVRGNLVFRSRPGQVEFRD
ncbi:peptidase C14, caspase catalytic subunit P20 [Leptolyngbya sp. NIES-3755]|nr:peptidase C14, caspase catalytic subunit P20 [Leptolyngbya sp. NIES-3755]